ncbi:metallophosphoesterase domain-containing protein 1-like [Branchiostoma lanceolatum]|uniref:metallophosphoesterase domain-containing protein 1-like n=1 Tax=Branchiostoma lanceolatum TaxID=7740 RepID=UPI001132E562
MSIRRTLSKISRRVMSSDSDHKSATLDADPLAAQPQKAWDQRKVVQTAAKVEPVPFDKEKPPGHIRFVCVSDTHSRSDRMGTIPDGDVLLHAGDFTDLGHLQKVKDFNTWLGTLPHPHKVVIAGNHDLTFDPKLMQEIRAGRRPMFWAVRDEEAETAKSLLTNCIYLEDSETNVMGIRIWGSPWQPWFYDWAFNEERGKPILEKWNLIPEGVDILVTHGPPLGHGDVTITGQHVGCVDLLNTIQKRVKPKYHIFGHIHEGYGITTDGTTTYVNASVCTVRYQPVNPPIVFDLPTPEEAMKQLAKELDLD